jgi:hypothetical protein
MTASSESASTPAYRTAGPTSSWPHPEPATTAPAPHRTVLEKVRDVALILASLCVVAGTIAIVLAGLTLGHALSQVGDRLDTPTPEVSCDPTYFNC